MASCVVIVLDVDGVGVAGSGLSFYPVGHPHVYVGAVLAGTRRSTLDFFLVESGVVELELLVDEGHLISQPSGGQRRVRRPDVAGEFAPILWNGSTGGSWRRSAHSQLSIHRTVSVDGTHGRFVEGWLARTW